MLEGILFLLAITFLTALAFVLVLMYFNIIKKKFKIGFEKTTKEEKKEYGWLVLDFNFNLFGKRIAYKSKKKNK
jgi:hypothetical protein